MGTPSRTPTLNELRDSLPKLKVHEAEARVVRRIFALYVEGLGYAAIAERHRRSRLGLDGGEDTDKMNPTRASSSRTAP